VYDKEVELKRLLMAATKLFLTIEDVNPKDRDKFISSMCSVQTVLANLKSGREDLHRRDPKG